MLQTDAYDEVIQELSNYKNYVATECSEMVSIASQLAEIDDNAKKRVSELMKKIKKIAEALEGIDEVISALQKEKEWALNVQ